MPDFIVGYFWMMAAFMLTLDFSIPIFLTLLVLIIFPISCLNNFAHGIKNGFLTTVRSVCRIE
jgi:hypothetical protein